MDSDSGFKLASSLRRQALSQSQISHSTLIFQSVKFVKCDVSKWDDQVRLFTEAATFTGKVDYVVANAGICPEDQVFSFAGDCLFPSELAFGRQLTLMKQGKTKSPQNQI